MRLDQLSEAIAAVCPIDGISSDGSIQYSMEGDAPLASRSQMDAAEALMAQELPTLDTSPVKNPTISDIIAVLDPQQKAALDVAVAVRASN